MVLFSVGLPDTPTKHSAFLHQYFLGLLAGNRTNVRLSGLSEDPIPTVLSSRNARHGPLNIHLTQHH